MNNPTNSTPSTSQSTSKSTSKARKWTPQETLSEVSYIQGVNSEFPGPAFNHSPGVFARYCTMQASQARHSGHHLSAVEILQIRDLALDFAGEARPASELRRDWRS